MAQDQQTFLNKWQEGSSENANIGFGTFVGVETYSKKGIAQLTKKASKVSASVVTDLPLYSAAASLLIMYVQGDTGKVYKTIDGGSTWTDITNATGYSTGAGKGLVFFQGYLFAFRGTQIEYYDGSSWHGTAWQTGLDSSVITACPFIFPNDNFVYFGNGSKVGKFGFGTDPVFDPSGSAPTNYFYDANWGGNTQGGILPSYYRIDCMSFYLPNYIALGTSSSSNAAVADLIFWNPTLSTYETPLRLYSQAESTENGIKQLINRNNVLYAVTGGSHSVFTTNGTSFQLVADLSLYSNIRKTTGMQAQVPVFMNPRPSAIDIFGNKLLTGVSTPGDISYYPSGYGLFPCGVWSLAFSDNDVAVQCEYTISTNTVVAVNKQYTVGMIRCIGFNQTLIGWKDGSSYGIDLVSPYNYQNEITAVMMESPMMEVGTPIKPTTIQLIQLNTTRELLTGQTVTFNYRTGFDKDYAPIGSFTVNNNGDFGYKFTQSDIGQTRFLQLQIQMASTSDQTYSPEIRNVIISS